MMPTISRKRYTTAYSKPRKRLLCWLSESNSHGLMYKQPIFLPEGKEPEHGEWIRAHWLDEPDRPPMSAVTGYSDE